MRLFIVLLGLIGSIYASDNNVTLDNLGNLGSFLEPWFAKNSENITHLLIVFGSILGGIITLFSIIFLINGYAISKRVDENRKAIDNTYLKIQEDIKQEVAQEIVYSSKELISKVENYFYEKIEYDLEQINRLVQAKLFLYQRFVFEVNEVKKIEYENLMNSSIKLEDKLSQLISIQNRYNETNNSSIPKLFSDDIEHQVVPAAKKLSENKKLQRIIVKHLETLIQSDYYSFADKARIKEVLHKRYNWQEPKDKETDTPPKN